MKTPETDPKSESKKRKRIRKPKPGGSPLTSGCDPEFSLPFLFIVVLLNLPFVFCLCARARYSLNRSTVDGGVYSVAGTIGQPDAGTSGMLVVNPLTGGWFYRLHKPWR